MIHFPARQSGRQLIEDDDIRRPHANRRQLRKLLDAVGNVRTSCAAWNVRRNPSRARPLGEMPLTRVPLTKIDPATGFSRPAITFATVLLPDPFGPLRPWM